MTEHRSTPADAVMSAPTAPAISIALHRRIAAAVAAFGAAMGAGGAGAQQVIYVDDDAPAGGNGMSWLTAFRDLQAALDAASQVPGVTAQVRVAQGRYNPDPAWSDPDALLELGSVSGVTLMGGFNGLTPGANPDGRSIHGYPTIIDGELGDASTMSDNSRTLIRIGPGRTARIEGITLERANRSAMLNEGWLLTEACTVRHNFAPAGAVSHVGGTMYDYNSRFTENTGRAMRVDGSAWTMLNGTRFEGNGDAGIEPGSMPVIDGGAISVGENAFVLLSGCTFDLNAVRGLGGAVFSRGELTAYGCRFAGNAAKDGGALVNWGEAVLSGCTLGLNLSEGTGGAVLASGAWTVVRECEFAGNVAAGEGGAIRSSGGMLAVAQSRFDQNRARDGGAISEHDVSGLVAHSLLTGNYAERNGGAMSSSGWTGFFGCTVSGNAAGDRGGAVYGEGTPGGWPVVSSTILWESSDSTGSSTWSSQAYAESGPVSAIGSMGPGIASENYNVQGDPMFAGPGDYRLRAGSPAINAFPYFFFSAPMVEHIDMDGFERPRGHFPDIGCYEAEVPAGCNDADMTATNVRGQAGWSIPDQRLTSDDLFFFIEQYGRGHECADLTRTTIRMDPYFGVPDGVVSPTDFFYFLMMYEDGCP